MTTKTFADFGIEVPYGRTGEVRVQCPECSPKRKREHQRERDLAVNVAEGTFFCHHCGWKGGLGEKDWRDQIPPKPVYTIPAPPQSTVLPESIVQWFAGRGIPDWVLSDAGITAGKEFDPNQGQEVLAIRFPYLRDGSLVNIKYRSQQKTFWMAKGAERILYGLDGLNEQTECVIVEGEIDKLTIDAVQGPACVSVPDGAPAVTATNYAGKFTFLQGVAEERFAAMQRVLIGTDKDEPGQKLADELARRIGYEKCARIVWPDGCKDANETLTTLGVGAVCDAIADAQPWPVAGIVTVRELRGALDHLYEHGFDRGVEVGWPGFDALYRVKPGLLSIVTGIPGSGKALSLDTVLPTPAGWTTMGEVQEGDELLDEQGKPCRVVRTTEVMEHRPCYRMIFSDRSQVVCDADHEWVTRDYAAAVSERNARMNGRDSGAPLKPRGTDQTAKRTFASAKRTEDIAGSLRAERGNRLNHAVRVALPLLLPHAELPIDPYVLGAWLGDGHSWNGAITTGDVEVIAEIEAAGYSVRKWTSRYLYGVHGLLVQLRGAGVLGRKHIPQEYLRASEAQRMALLQGLMDTDGYVAEGGDCEYTSMSGDLAFGVWDLALSLGIKATVRVGRATLNGKDCGEKYRVAFTTDKPVVRLTRKLARIPSAVRETQSWRYVASCEPVASVPVRCIEVDSPSHQFLCTRALIPTHNSHFLDNILVRLADQHGWTIGICSPENQPVQRHLAGLLAIHAKSPFAGGDFTRMSVETMRHEARWAERHFAFVLPDEPTIAAILERADVLVYRMGIRGLVIDPWNELDHSRPPGMTETEFTSQSLSRLRNWARSHGVHVWLVAHPTKLHKTDDDEYPVPTPYDISGSAHFYNKADACLSVWRARGSDAPEVHVQKVRFQETGKLGMASFVYNRPTGCFNER